MNKSYIFYGVCALIVLMCICQDDILILFQDTELNEGKLKNAAIAQVDTVTTAVPLTAKTESLSVTTLKDTVNPVQNVPQTFSDVETPVKKPVQETVNPEHFGDRLQTVTLNGKSYPGLEEEVLACIAYVENFSDTAYFCGAKWTIGYGTTAYPDGSSVSPGQRITRKYALECVRRHLRRYVFPVIETSVEKQLSQNEMIATCLFVYNIGGGNFTNRKGMGPCAFLNALNNNESAEECARKMTECRYAAGNVAEGLLKRRWVEGAIFCGYLTPTEILLLNPAGFYNVRGLNEYYTGYRPDRDGLYSFRYDQDTVENFLDRNRGNCKRVKDII